MSSNFMAMTFQPDGDPSFDLSRKIIKSINKDNNFFELYTKEKVLIAIKELEEAWDSPQSRNDVQEFKIHGYEFLVTGGMSIGESPTELFETLIILANCGLLWLIENKSSEEQFREKYLQKGS